MSAAEWALAIVVIAVLCVAASYVDNHPGGPHGPARA